MKDYTPYDLPGRWYKAHITSNGTTLTLVECDDNIVTIDGNNIVAVSPDFHIVDRIIDYTILEGASTFSAGFNIGCATGGNQMIAVGSSVPARISSMDVYIRGYMAAEEA